MAYIDEIFSLKGKTAAVIGGGGVLAGSMAEGLAKAGADVAILDLNLDAAQAKADALKELGVKSLAIEVNVTSKEALEAACDQLKNDWGKVDILINAPGINSSTPYFEIEQSEWEKIMAVNLTGIFLACQVFGKLMVDQKSGSIINVSSMSSGPPLSKVFTYSVSKAGINNLTQNLAREWAPSNVRVNAIMPGFFPAEQNRKILTPERTQSIFGHTPMARFGNAEELLGVILMLSAEKASSFVTGALIPVDGGFSAMTI